MDGISPKLRRRKFAFSLYQFAFNITRHWIQSGIMMPTKIVYLAIASDDPVHKKDEQSQRETFVQDLHSDSTIYWLHGSTFDDTFIKDCHMYVNVKEEYSNILQKTITGIQYLTDFVDFDLIIRTNVSTYFEDAKIRKKVQSIALDQDFFGGFVESCQDYFGESQKSFTFVSGTGIFLSKRAAKSLCDLNYQDYTGIPDDVAISHFMKKNNRAITRMRRSNFSYLHILIGTTYVRLKSSVHSNLASERFRLIYSMRSSKNLSGMAWNFVLLHLNELRYLDYSLRGLFRYIQRIFIYLHYDFLTWVNRKVSSR